MVARLLGAKGRVLPMAAVPLQIVAEVIGLDPLAPDEISSIHGQAQVAKTTGRGPLGASGAERSAGLPGLGRWPSRRRTGSSSDPGSWFTSVIPHLLVPELAEAIHSTAGATPARPSISSRRGRPPGSAPPGTSSCWPSTLRTCGWMSVLADQRFASDDPHLASWAKSLGAELVVADLGVRDGSPRHDPLRLASAYAEIMGI